VQIPNGLIGCQVYQVKFDYQTALLLRRRDGGNSATHIDAWLVIETPFALRSRDGSAHELDPGTSRSALAPVIDLFLAAVANVSIEGRGTLTLDFADGAKLTVPPNETYESWALSGDGVPGILVGPGGETDWTEALRGLFRLCSVRRPSAAANDADQRAVKPQVRPHRRRSGNCRRKFEMYFDL
jgi:hypothetical protein